MNKTLKEIVYDILEAIYNYHITDDSELLAEHVAAKVHSINQRLVEESMKQNMNLESFYTKSCCNEVKCDKISCVVGNDVLDSDDVIWYMDVPSLNVRIGQKNISYLGTPDLKNNFNRVTLSGFMAGNVLEWTKNTLYTVIGNKIIFKDLPDTGTKFLCLIAVLADPTTSCNWLDDSTPYPTPDCYKLELLVKQDILSTRGVKDLKSDSMDTNNVQAQTQQQQSSNE